MTADDVDYAALFEALPSPVLALSAETGVVVDASEAFCAMADRPATDLVGEPVTALVSGAFETAEGTGSPLEGVRRGESVTRRCRVASGDGSATAASVELTAAAGEFVLARFEERAASARTREPYEALVETAPVPMWIQRGTEVVSANDVAAEFHGVERASDLVGRSVLEFVVPEEREATRERIRAVHEEFEPLRTVEGRIATESGRCRYGLFAGAPTTYRGEAAAVVVAEEITDQKDRERELERRNERLDRFASTASHDLRTPLSVLRGRLTLARETGEEEHFERADEAIDRMETIVDDVLAVAREGTTAVESTFEAVSLPDVVAGAWETVDTRRATLDADADLDVLANREQLWRAFENLFRNAVEHGGPEVTVTVGTLRAAGAIGSPCGFFVADDGPGIPPGERDRVLRSGYTGRSGTGLGLAIVSDIAGAHGWDLTVAEADGGGARFEFTGVDAP